MLFFSLLIATNFADETLYSITTENLYPLIIDLLHNDGISRLKNAEQKSNKP